MTRIGEWLRRIGYLLNRRRREADLQGVDSLNRTSPADPNLSH